MQISPDGRIIAACGHGGKSLQPLSFRPLVNWVGLGGYADIPPSEEIVLLDSETGQITGRIPNNNAVVFSPDGKTAFTVRDREIQVWEIPPHKSLAWLAIGASLLCAAHRARRPAACRPTESRLRWPSFPDPAAELGCSPEGSGWRRASGLWWVYVRTHPLVFMKTHTNCITMAELEFAQYAADHEGRYPFHSKGYPNALLLMDQQSFNALTGPGYETTALNEAKRTGGELSEDDCGRVYIQGLAKKFEPNIAMLFDKLPTPGGDHCPFPFRMWAPLVREVLMSEGTHTRVRESEWPEFSKRQVNLLVSEGWNRQEAERLFASKPNGTLSRACR